MVAVAARVGQAAGHAEILDGLVECLEHQQARIRRPFRPACVHEVSVVVHEGPQRGQHSEPQWAAARVVVEHMDNGLHRCPDRKRRQKWFGERCGCRRGVVVVLDESDPDLDTHDAIGRLQALPLAFGEKYGGALGCEVDDQQNAVEGGKGALLGRLAARAWNHLSREIGERLNSRCR